MPEVLKILRGVYPELAEGLRMTYVGVRTVVGQSLKVVFLESKWGEILEKSKTALIPSNHPPFSPGCTF